MSRFGRWWQRGHVEPPEADLGPSYGPAMRCDLALVPDDERIGDREVHQLDGGIAQQRLAMLP
jgi:hypothetical protein